MMSAGELRTLRHLALSIASATSAMLELLEGTESSETSGPAAGSGEQAGTVQGIESAPEQLRVFGRKAAEPKTSALGGTADTTPTY